MIAPETLLLIAAAGAISAAWLAFNAGFVVGAGWASRLRADDDPHQNPENWQ